MLSRVSWPVVPFHKMLRGIEEAYGRGQVKRVCVQALNYPETFQQLPEIAKAIRQRIKVPISISCQPLRRENIKKLFEAGVERIGIPLDAATEQIFDDVKGLSAGGPYSWKRQYGLLKEAVKVFGKGRVSTHFIVGLGENERQMIHAIQRIVDNGILPALFAFTPIAGTKMERIAQPSVDAYRRIQVARYLIVGGLGRCQDFFFDNGGRLINFNVADRILKVIIKTGEPFRTSGCPDCNRPYYNERPSGPIYNYSRTLTQEELVEIGKQFTPKR